MMFSLHRHQNIQWIYSTKNTAGLHFSFSISNGEDIRCVFLSVSSISFPSIAGPMTTILISCLSSSHIQRRYLTFAGGGPRTFIKMTDASFSSSISLTVNGGAGSPDFLEQHVLFGFLSRHVPSVQNMKPLRPQKRLQP